MTDVTIDASVWVAAADQRDAFYAESRVFLAAVTVEQIRIVIPAFAGTEVACALARKLHSTALGRQLTNDVLSGSLVIELPADASLIGAARLVGTSAYLRGADALYAATAQISGSQLVTWDKELIERVGAMTPTAWLDADP